MTFAVDLLFGFCSSSLQCIGTELFCRMWHQRFFLNFYIRNPLMLSLPLVADMPNHGGVRVSYIPECQLPYVVVKLVQTYLSNPMKRMPYNCENSGVTVWGARLLHKPWRRPLLRSSDKCLGRFCVPQDGRLEWFKQLFISLEGLTRL